MFKLNNIRPTGKATFRIGNKKTSIVELVQVYFATGTVPVVFKVKGKKGSLTKQLEMSYVDAMEMAISILETLPLATLNSGEIHKRLHKLTKTIDKVMKGKS